MAQNKLLQQERLVGLQYAAFLEAALRRTINLESPSFARLALRTFVESRTKEDGRLQRLALVSPKHSFVHHYGFEGINKNGKALSLEAKSHLSGLKEEAILNDLADEIGEIRAEEVTASIDF